MVKVSVIIPVYNVEKYVKKCIQSVVNQTYSKLEIIIVDDGSTDKSSTICDDFAAEDKRIKVIHQSNQGLSAARNTGILSATGDYLFFVDSDDWIDKDTIKTLFLLITKSQSDIAACGVMKVWEDGKTESFTQNIQFIMDGKMAVCEMITGNTLCSVIYNKLYKRILWEGISFPVNRFHEDEFTTYKLLYRAKKVIYSGDEMYFYRQRKGSIMSEISDKRIEDILDAMQQKILYFGYKSEDEIEALSVIHYMDYIKYIYRIVHKDKSKSKLCKELICRYNTQFNAIYCNKNIPFIYKLKAVIWKIIKY
ncbi:MAG: glycosyltransferase [Lachnospiraceae bacterium]|nr:glycosyltransferase [Lachnospiraceae bacterium]